MITFDPDKKLFRLDAKGFSCLLGVPPQGGLHHLYWGPPLEKWVTEKLFLDWQVKTANNSPNAAYEAYNREFADFGHNDLRTPAFLLEQSDGSRVSFFTYLRHEILAGKPAFPGLPSSTVEKEDEARTLVITLADEAAQQELTLYYTLYPEWDILIRRTRLLNQGTGPCRILKLMSLGLDLPAADYKLISFGGAWARERHFQERPLLQGIVRLESRRGISSHDLNPFVMVAKAGAGEEEGRVYGLSLAYSGNWLLEAEVYHDHRLRLNNGINDFGFKWTLDPGQSFTTPECVTSYSEKGYDGLSQAFHRFVRQRVARGTWRDKPRPILINNWEATYFNFKHEDIVRIGKSAKELGVELLVLDDGWFGERDKDDSSLGDWFEDPKKIPKGLKGLGEELHGLGLLFGIWVEPEMVSPRSRLYEKHPDWCLHVPGRERKTARDQLVLDMGQKEIRDFLFETLSRVFEEGKADYVKWDMNRPLSEVGSLALPPHRQSEVSHRYVLGLYELMERLNKRFPGVLFEGCAGGGGRFDLGILSYHPQIWSSDNMDGLDRMLIQYGTTFGYPPIAQGSHVSSSPNHITKRESPLKWRAHLAMSANFGLELDVSEWSKAERKEMAGYIALYKEIRETVQFGNFHRLESPYGTERCSWMFTSPGLREALLFVFQVKPPQEPSAVKPIRLRGLDPNQYYEILGKKLFFTGKKLMEKGWLPETFRAGNIPGPLHCGLFRIQAKG